MGHARRVTYEKNAFNEAKRNDMKAHAIRLAVGGAAAIILVAADEPSDKFKFSFQHKDDAVEVRTDAQRTLLDVKSSTGIGYVAIERQGARWPKIIAVRLHLEGLEGFTASNGKVELLTGIPVMNYGKSPKAITSKREGKTETSIDEKSPYWPAMNVVGADGKPAAAVPLKNGYFEITLPPAFFDGNPKSITLNWVNFYR